MSSKVQQSVCSDCVTYAKSRIKFNTLNTFNNVKQATVTQIEKIWLSNKEAQAYLGVGIDFLKNLRSSGRISFFKVGTTVFYRKRDIDRLIEKNRVC